MVSDSPSSPKVVFAVYDSTSARCLQPIANQMENKCEIEYLLLDNLLPRSSMKSEISEDEFQPYRRASHYVKSEFLQRLNNVEKPHPIGTIIFQRIVEDNISPEISYDIPDYLSDSQPDIFITAHDQLPFLKHIIKESQRREFNSVLIQHGINRPDLEDPSNIPGVPNLLSPSRFPTFGPFEYLKRRIGFKYGAYLFCNPFIDEVYTFGEFFTKLLGELRTEYPCNGDTEITTAGTTEYDPGSVEDYSSDISSAIFLSQWQYEHDIWRKDEQEYISSFLKELANNTGIPITIRPHPKDSQSKISKFYSDFNISDKADIWEDIRSHDMIITIDSTAIFLGVLLGKSCGIIQPPWDNITFRPFTHPHIIQINDSTIDLRKSAAKRTCRTQISYLNECCFVPNQDKGSPFDSPTELITSSILE